FVNSANSVDLALTMTPSSLNPPPGSNVTFNLAVSNTGAVPATNVVVQDLLPAGLTFVSATPSAGTYSSLTGLWLVGTLNAPASATLQIVATLTTSSAVVNFAEVNGCDQPDIDSTLATVPGEDD